MTMMNKTLVFWSVYHALYTHTVILLL